MFRVAAFNNETVMPSMVEEPFNTADQTRSFDCAQDDKKNSALKEQVTLNMIYYILVGSTLYQNNNSLASCLKMKILVYIVGISYALYVIHPFLLHTWLGSGDKIVEYAKRPLLFIALFLLAHLSTFYYEKHWTSVGKLLSRSLSSSIWFQKFRRTNRNEDKA